MKLSRNALRGAVAVTMMLGCTASGLAANIAIVGGRADDPFFAVVKRGIDDAAKLVTERVGSGR